MSRGRKAKAPTQIPGPGWKDIFWRLKDAITEDRVALIAAGVAFYGLLAIFPAITALMAIAGLMVEPQQVTQQLEGIIGMMPDQAAQIVVDQAAAVAGSGKSGLSIAFMLGLGLAIFSASKGVGSLMQGLNVAYGEDEKRGFVKRMATTLGLTVLLVIGALLGLAAATAVPALLAVVDLPGGWVSILSYGRWVLMLLLTILGLGVLYRFGPSRSRPNWIWLAPGTLIACLLWIVASMGFSYYVANFASYNESFGSMAGVILLLMWLWISAFFVLLGAEINFEIEAQTRHDTTTGPDQSMGERGAVMADERGDTAEN